MNKLVAGIAIVAQLVGLVAIYWMLFEFFSLPAELLQQFTADTETTQRYLIETFASWQPWPFVGFVGAVVAWLLMLNGRCRDAWFLTMSFVIALEWLLRARSAPLRRSPYRPE